MLQLRDVLEFVIDRLYDRPFAEQYLVGDAHQAVLHVVLHLGYQLDAVDEQFLEQLFRYVSFVTDQLPVDLLDEAHGLERLAVVDVGRSEHEGEDFSFLVDDQVQLESEEPPHRALSPCGDALEDLVAVDALVAAHPHGGGIHEADACALA